MKKKIIVPIAIVVVIALVTGAVVALDLTKFMKDSEDTEALFLKNVNSIGYENTIEDAIPQTELFSVIKEHFNAPLAEGKTEKKAIIIGYDGCRADILTEIQQENSAITTLLENGATFNLAYCGGVEYPEKNTQATSTAPGWCSVLTGKWADEHSITGNDITKEVEPKTLLTSLVEDGVIDSSSFITKWAGHFSRDNATYLLEKEYCEKNDLAVSFNKCKNDKASLDFTLEEIEKENCADFLFVIYEQTDSVGHSFGFSYNNPRYKEALREIDSYGYETLKAIRERETYDSEDWLVIVTSDHGGINTDHGGDSIQERMTFAVIY